MNFPWAKAGAAFYFLWGVMHVMLGTMMVSKLSGADASGMLAMVATGASAGDATAAIPPVAIGLLKQHGWNLVVFGLVASVVAVRLNWRNDRAGYWFNLALISLADLGFIVMILVPGYMAVSGEAVAGPVLWLAGAAASSVARGKAAPAGATAVAS